tara:strand:+ start:5070 stop:5477 length:408 start_codon:yes stop_codon:yes gene_type:complete
MFKWIGSIFGGNSDKVMEVAKGVGGWIDEQQFTEEEKSVAKFKALDYQLQWLNATQGMNTTRRFIAIAIVMTFLFSFVVSLAAFIIGWSLDLKVKELVDGILEIVIAFELGFSFLTIMVFYFGKGMVEKISMKNK